jgi:hypothetical protein
MITKLKTILNESSIPVRVSFTKLDGTIRDMECTTNLDLIPVEFHPKQRETPPTPNDKVVCAYDLEHNGWRSFIADNVISFELIQ